MVAQSSRPPSPPPFLPPVVIPTLPSLPLLSPTGTAARARFAGTNAHTHKPAVCVV